MGLSLLVILAVVVLARRVADTRFEYPVARRQGAVQGIGFGGLCAALLAMTGPLHLWKMAVVAALCIGGMGWHGARLATLYGDTRSLMVFPAALAGFLLAATVSGAAFWGAFFGVPVAVGMTLRGAYGIRWTPQVRQRAAVSAAVLLIALICGSFFHLF